MSPIIFFLLLFFTKKKKGRFSFWRVDCSMTLLYDWISEWDQIHLTWQKLSCVQCLTLGEGQDIDNVLSWAEWGAKQHQNLESQQSTHTVACWTCRLSKLESTWIELTGYKKEKKKTVKRTNKQNHRETCVTRTFVTLECHCQSSLCRPRACILRRGQVGWLHAKRSQPCRTGERFGQDRECRRKQRNGVSVSVRTSKWRNKS